MTISIILVKILEYMFVAGWAGSVLVLLITGVEDIGTMLDTEDETSH